MNQGGVDVNCGNSPAFYQENLCKAVAHGSISSADLDRATRRLFRTMMKLGTTSET
jgi:beta-glucosidase-like glycosyl hydrolase